MGSLVLADVAVFGHAAENGLLARFVGFRVGTERGISGWCLRKSGEDGAFGEGEISRGFVEVELSG